MCKNFRSQWGKTETRGGGGLLPLLARKNKHSHAHFGLWLCDYHNTYRLDHVKRTPGTYHDDVRRSPSSDGTYFFRTLVDRWHRDGKMGR